MKFNAKILLGGKTATGIQVPEDVMHELGSKRPTVKVTINKHTYRTTVGSVGDKFMIPLSADNRAKAAVEAGQWVDVILERDTEPRTMAAPPDLLEALEKKPKAKQFFDALSYSHKRAYTEWIESAKKTETRQRRVTEALSMLSQGLKR